MGLMLLPQNAPDAVKNVAYMVDEIWYHAGDTSTDVRAQECNYTHGSTYHIEITCLYW